MLLAPSRSANALVGPGDSEVRSTLDMDGAWLAEGLAGGAVARRTLEGFDAALAVTRSRGITELLEQCIPRVLVCDPRPSGEHASTCLVEALRELGCAPSDEYPPEMLPTPDEVDAVLSLLKRLSRPFLAVHPGSGSSRKNWPQEAYALLVTRLSAGHPWLLVRGPAEAGQKSPLEGLPGAVPLTDWPLRHLGALLRHAALFVGNDSGVSHLAAAWGAPVLALFGPTDPSLWAPVGRKVRVVRSPTEDMEDLAVATVCDAALGLAKTKLPH